MTTQCTSYNNTVLTTTSVAFFSTPGKGTSLPSEHDTWALVSVLGRCHLPGLSCFCPNLLPLRDEANVPDRKSRDKVKTLHCPFCHLPHLVSLSPVCRAVTICGKPGPSLHDSENNYACVWSLHQHVHFGSVLPQVVGQVFPVWKPHKHFKQDLQDH